MLKVHARIAESMRLACYLQTFGGGLFHPLEDSSTGPVSRSCFPPIVLGPLLKLHLRWFRWPVADVPLSKDVAEAMH